MENSWTNPNSEMPSQIKWVLISRIIFTLILICGCFIFSTREQLSFFSQPFLGLYNTAALMLVLSVFYLVWLNKFNAPVSLAYVQTIIDTCIVTAIIYMTGSHESVFTFLYLVVIIYASMLLFLKGSLIIATIASVQYGLLIELEIYSVIPKFLDASYYENYTDTGLIIYRIIIVILACFAVAVLSGLLARQLKGARLDLKVAQEHLKRVERMEVMDELISGIAHEIKNPLASLSGSIQLLQEDTDPGSYEDKLMQIILRETDRLKVIVNDIRLFAKPSTQNAIPVKLADAIEETAQLFLNDPKWNERIRLTMKLDPRIYVEIDPAHLNQILWNLLKNAAQAIEGEGDIFIRLRFNKTGRVHLTIRDTGQGIDEKTAAHIFDPFFTSKPDGTGLGLPIIHRLIDTYHGMIDFETSPEGGTEFTILLNGIPS